MMSTSRLFGLMVATILVGLALLVSPALAEKRVALLIGNADYPTAPLRNPTNDVDAMETALKGAGFDLVIARKNLDLRGMDAAVEEFREKARGAAVAVMFYSGHGIEVDGVNYLVPKNAVLDNDRTVKREALALDDVLDAMQGATKLRLVLLDACRDNPFVSGMKRTKSAATRGLGRMEPPMSDTLIAYATAAGRTATDGDGVLSPFTAALVKHIVTPGLDVELALRRVRDDVREATRAWASREKRDPQEPYKTGSIGSTLIALNVRPGNGAASLSVPAAPALSPPVDLSAVAAADFDRAKSIGTVASWDWFLGRHSSSVYAGLAREARDKLSSSGGSSPLASTPSPPSKIEVASSPPAKAEFVFSDRFVTKRQAEQARIELTETLPSELDRLHKAVLAEARVAEAYDRANATLVDGRLALDRKDQQAARKAITDLNALLDRLRQDYALRIVSRTGEQSGIWRTLTTSPNVRNYYLIVEPVTASGTLLKLPITSEEDQKTATVDRFGIRVSQDVYDAVRRDKTDDNIIQRAVIGQKARGHLEPTYTLPVLGGHITEGW